MGGGRQQEDRQAGRQAGVGCVCILVGGVEWIWMCVNEIERGNQLYLFLHLTKERGAERAAKTEMVWVSTCMGQVSKYPCIPRPLVVV